MPGLPPFNSDGLLPPGEYALTFAEVRQSHLVKRPAPSYANWNEAWRGQLVEWLELLVGQLWKVGISEVFADGSFVDDKDHPNDIDGYFNCDLKYLASGKLQQDLNALDPHKVWTWDPISRKPHLGYPKLQLPMWHQYRVELYPNYGQPSGIRDAKGNNMPFAQAFRQSRTDSKPRGIIHIMKGAAS